MIFFKLGHVSKFQNVVGAVDGTHIAVKAPAEEEHIYVNRKYFILSMSRLFVMPI